MRSWETSDEIRVWLRSHQREVIIISATNLDHNSQVAEGIWQEFSSSAKAADFAGHVQMCFGLDSNSASETVFVDHLQLHGQPRGGTSCVRLTSQPASTVNVGIDFVAQQVQPRTTVDWLTSLELTVDWMASSKHRSCVEPSHLAFSTQSSVLRPLDGAVQLGNCFESVISGSLKLPKRPAGSAARWKLDFTSKYAASFSW